jgi:sensor histidine kinase YesM
MIIQIYVENALKHGIFHIEKDGFVSIKISEKFHRILIEISDNGAGREYTKGRGTASTGKGTMLMEKYSNLLNKAYAEKIQIETEDLYSVEGDSAGTKVRIEILTA